ncbi:MAG: lactate utilization protein [Desulfobacterales bacterium]|nr:lactate utilization protein [Desulfobacterales bacterium]
MTAADEKIFLANVRRALGIDSPRRAPWLFPESPSDRSRRLLEKISKRTGEEVRTLIHRLEEAAAPLNIDLHVAPDIQAAAAVVVRLAADKSPEWADQKTVAAWRHPLVERLDLPAALDAPVFFSEPDPGLSEEEARRRMLERIAKSFIGVTAADFCLADTATLVLRSRPGQARSVSLLPSIHVAIVETDQLLADLAELYALLSWDPEQKTEGLSTCLTLITGPSKTADIEATLVHGAHGPRELHLVVLEQNS